jgi:hypothetical protein
MRSPPPQVSSDTTRSDGKLSDRREGGGGGGLTVEKVARRGCLFGRGSTVTDRAAAEAAYGSCGRLGATHRPGLAGRQPDRRENWRCPGRERRAMEPRPLDPQPSRTASAALCTYSVGYGACSRPGATGAGPVRRGASARNTRQAFRSVMDQVLISGTLMEVFRAGGQGEASWYGSSSSRRLQIEYRYVRVLEWQPHRSPRRRPVRRGTRT